MCGVCACDNFRPCVLTPATQDHSNPQLKTMRGRVAPVCLLMTRIRFSYVFAFVALWFSAGAVAPASAQTPWLAPQERMCDPAFEDCRADILTYIQQETVAIDMGYWMMTDARYSNALVAAKERGVKIRLLMDPNCADQHPACVAQNDQLRAAGIPMRRRQAGGILHWKQHGKKKA